MSNEKEIVPVPEHTLTEHLTIAYWYPKHGPRRGSIEDKMFRETKARMQKVGIHECWINNADCGGGPLEMHHSLVENALIEAVSVEHFIALYPEFGIKTDEEFHVWTQSEGNLLCLCPMHHRGILGIHTIHYSAWVCQRFLKAGAMPPEHLVPKQKSKVSV